MATIALRQPPQDRRSSSALSSSRRGSPQVQLRGAAGEDMQTIVVQWMGAVLEDRLDCDEGDEALHALLRDGVLLCDVANRIRPGIVDRVVREETLTQTFQNAARFVQAARALGVPEDALIETNDLIGGSNMRQVRLCIYTLGRAAHHADGYEGPTLGRPLHGRKPQPPPSARRPSVSTEAMRASPPTSPPPLPPPPLVVVFDFDGTLATLEVGEEHVDLRYLEAQDAARACFGSLNRQAMLSRLLGDLEARGCLCAIVSRNEIELITAALEAVGWTGLMADRVYGGEALCTNSPFGDKSVTIRKAFLAQAPAGTAPRVAAGILFVDDSEANCHEVSRALGVQAHWVEGRRGLSAADASAILGWADDRIAAGLAPPPPEN